MTRSEQPAHIGQAGLGPPAGMIMDLARIVREVDPAAVVADSRVISRIIRRDRGIVGLGIHTPHDRCYCIARRSLTELAEPDELHVAAIEDLPETVILLSWAAPRADSGSPADDTLPNALLSLQRQLFHVKVHLAIERRIACGQLTPAALRQRIHRIGQTEFDEVRSVLRSERLLLPPRDNATVYGEFSATCLEARHFAPALLSRYFPTISQPPRDEAVEAVLAEDVDAAAILAASRLPGAAACELDRQPDRPAVQVVAARPVVAPPKVDPARLRIRADRVAEIGNLVRAAILRTRAAGAKQGQSACPPACEAMSRLTGRLAAVLHLDADRSAHLATALTGLLPAAVRGYRAREARFLFELQKACIAYERELFSIDVVDWLAAWGQRPFKRPLPIKRQLLVVQHFRKAVAKLAAAGEINGAPREELQSLLEPAVRSLEARFRDRVRETLVDAMNHVGLIPAGLPETVARDKVVEELVDRTTERGFLTMGDVRDAISRNNIKLPDLGGPVKPTRPGLAWFPACWPLPPGC